MVMEATAAANQLVVRRNRPGTSAKVSGTTAFVLLAVLENVSSFIDFYHELRETKNSGLGENFLNNLIFNQLVVCCYRSSVGGKMSPLRKWIVHLLYSNLFNS